MDVIVSPKLLREWIQYDPESGKLFWKERDAKYFDNSGSAFLWNADNAGKEIFKKSGAGGYGGYRVQAIMGENFMGHRVAWAIHHGEWPTGALDHVNGQTRDNRLCNLREADNVLNQRNKVLQSNNTSGHVGVQKTKHGTFEARILNRNLGTFKTFEEAVKARQEAQSSTPGFTERHGKPRIVDYGFSHLKHSRLQRKLKRQFA